MEQLPKILFVALESYSLVGGLQQFNRRVVSALSELSQKYNRTRSTVILKGDESEHVKDRPEHVIFKTCGQSRKAIVREVLAESNRADVMLLGHINLLPIAFLVKLIRPKIKIILFVHGIDVWGNKGRKIKKLDRYFIKFVDKIASVSAFTAKKMEESFAVQKEKFVVFPNAVDSLNTRIFMSCINKKPILLTVARLSENEFGKHHDSVLKALPKILQEFPKLKYRVIGDGALKKDLQKLAESLGVANAVEFKGRVSDEELAKAYEEAAIFVMPSEKEGFGIVFLEAWLRGIPVICGTEDASHEVVSNGVDGFAIHHNDIDLIAEKILFLLRDPVCAAEMGRKGFNKVMNNYLMSNFINNLDMLLKGDK